MATQAELVWVADSTDDKIQARLKTDLSVSVEVGSHGSGNAQFDAPARLSCDLYAVYVNDVGNSRLKKHVGTTLAWIQSNTWASLSLPTVSALAVDKRRCFIGKTATDTYVYDLHKNTFAAEHAYFDCGAGGVVGLAAIQDYFYVADATRVEKRLLADGTLAATWNTVPAGFAVASLTTDGAHIYVFCTKAVTAAKVVTLELDLTGAVAADLPAGKESVVSACCDGTYFFFTCTNDTTINRIDLDLGGGSLIDEVMTAPKGVCCLSSYFTDLRTESVGDVTGSVSMAATGSMAGRKTGPVTGTASAALTGSATVSKVKSVAASVAAAMTGSAVFQKVGAIVASVSAALTGSAVIRKLGSVAASVAMAMTGSATIELGTAQVGDESVVNATLGTASDVTATVRW